MSQIKFLDLAGLTAYDKLLKEWFKSGVVDIADDAIRELFNAPQVTGPADNEIWYWTSDGQLSHPNEGISGINSIEGTMIIPFNESIVSNVLVPETYEDGLTGYKGVITLSGPLKSINFSAFRNNQNISDIKFPNTLEEIGGSAFAESNINWIIIPNSVKKIGYRAFEGCKNYSFDFDGTVSEWNSVEKGYEWCIGSFATTHEEGVYCIKDEQFVLAEYETMPDLPL